MATQATSPALSWPEKGRVAGATNEFAMLESLVRDHARFVFKVAYSVLRNSYDSEDVVQEVYLRAHRCGTKGVEDVRAWLARVAFHASRRLCFTRRTAAWKLSIR